MDSTVCFLIGVLQGPYEGFPFKGYHNPNRLVQVGLAWWRARKAAKLVAEIKAGKVPTLAKDSSQCSH